MHIHVVAAGKEAKFWLQPTGLAWNDGFPSGELKEIEKLIDVHLSLLVETWNAFFRRIP